MNWLAATVLILLKSMKNNTIIIWAVIIVGLFGLMWWGGQSQASRPPQEQNETKSVLISDKNLFEFGTISMAKGLASTVFKVTNPTEKDINVESITTSCMCTNAYILKGTEKKGPFGMLGHGVVPKANEIIKAGETRDIEVVYDPAAHGPAGVGPIDRFIYLRDTSGSVLNLEIKATVTP